MGRDMGETGCGSLSSMAPQFDGVHEKNNRQMSTRTDFGDIELACLVQLRPTTYLSLSSGGVFSLVSSVDE